MLIFTQPKSQNTCFFVKICFNLNIIINQSQMHPSEKTTKHPNVRGVGVNPYNQPFRLNRNISGFFYDLPKQSPWSILYQTVTLTGWGGWWTWWIWCIPQSPLVSIIGLLYANICLIFVHICFIFTNICLFQTVTLTGSESEKAKTLRIARFFTQKLSG